MGTLGPFPAAEKGRNPELPDLLRPVSASARWVRFPRLPTCRLCTSPCQSSFSPQATRAGYGFKGGRGVERSHRAARRAGLDFKSPRPISGAQALVTFPAPRLNSRRSEALPSLYPDPARFVEQLREHECGGNCREAGAGTSGPRESRGSRRCSSRGPGGCSAGERDPGGPSGPAQPAALPAGTLSGEGRLC